MHLEFPEGHLLQLERNLMTGKGRWIADFNESFRDFQVKNSVFDIFINGNTRMKGFLLSRIFSFLLNPNYPVGCFMLAIRPSEKFTRTSLHECLEAIRFYMDNQEMRWTWLVILGQDIEEKIERAVENIRDETIGVVAVNVKRGLIVNSNSLIGRQARKFIKV